MKGSPFFGKFFVKIHGDGYIKHFKYSPVSLSPFNSFFFQNSPNKIRQDNLDKILEEIVSGQSNNTPSTDRNTLDDG